MTERSTQMSLNETFGMLNYLKLCPAPFPKSAVVTAFRVVTRKTVPPVDHNYMVYENFLDFFAHLYEDYLAGSNVDPKLTIAATAIQRRLRGIQTRKAVVQKQKKNGTSTVDSTGRIFSRRHAQNPDVANAGSPQTLQEQD